VFVICGDRFGLQHPRQFGGDLLVQLSSGGLGEFFEGFGVHGLKREICKMTKIKKE
jgi:hypothetical protein